MVILGIDFSTKAIHGALIPLEHDNGEPPVVFRQEAIKQSHDPLTRYFEARMSTRRLCRDTDDGHPVHLVVVEQPMGRYAIRPLWAMFGAIVASVPGIAAVTALEPQAWRRELGLSGRLSKQDAIFEAMNYILGDYLLHPQRPCPKPPMNEHYAEALLIALAGRQQNNRNWANAS